MRLVEITLISETETLDSLNQPTTTESTTDVVAEMRSITRAEFFNARQGGLTPEYMFIVSAFDYAGQKVLKYNGTRYAIYRTYDGDDDDHVELYTQVDGGVTNV